MHLPQPTHLSRSMAHLPSVMTGAPWAQFLMQRPQPMQSAVRTKGLPAECISILPAREPLAHAEVLYRAAEAGEFVALKVAQ